MARNPFRTGHGRSVFGGAAVALAALVLLGGCGGGKSGTGGTTVKKSAASPQSLEEKCQAILGSVNETFQLDRLAQDALRPAGQGKATILNDGVQRLNDWNQSCGGELAARELPDPVRRLLTDEQRGLVSGARFIERDGEHLRDCLLLRSMARRALQVDDSVRSERSELSRVTAAFRYVVCALELVPRPPDDLPLTPFEICLLGKATAEDRAWVFASLLRQEKFDAVVIGRPGSAERPSGPQGPFLVGVLADRNIHLFDPRLGIPIPAPAGNGPADAGVATLEQAAGDPAVLRQLDADGQAYPLTAEDLARPGVWLIGDTGFWSERMRNLQGHYHSENEAIIADPLHETDRGPGLLERVAGAGGSRFDSSAIAVWSHPEAQLAAHAKLDKEQKTAVAELLSPFAAYKVIVRNPRTGETHFIDREQLNDPALAKGVDEGKRVSIRTTAGTQMRARLAQLEGRLPEALLGYQDVAKRAQVVAGFETTPPDIRAPHAQAVDDAWFWLGLCKFEQGEYQVAVDSFARYRRRQSDGSWVRQTRYLLALCHAEQKDFKSAIAELSKVKADDPEYLGRQWLIRRWKAAADSRPEANGALQSGERTGGVRDGG